MFFIYINELNYFIGVDYRFFFFICKEQWLVWLNNCVIIFILNYNFNIICLMFTECSHWMHIMNTSFQKWLIVLQA